MIHPNLGSFKKREEAVLPGRAPRIGAGALVEHDVPGGCTAVGVPARLTNCTEAGLPA
jgi:serine O-acetyltransferase